MNDNAPETGSRASDENTSGEQDFTFSGQKRPVNRNLIVIALIVAVGGAAVYAMSAQVRIQPLPPIEPLPIPPNVPLVPLPQRVNQTVPADMVADPFGPGIVIDDTKPKPLDINDVRQAAAKALVSAILTASSDSSCLIKTEDGSTIYKAGEAIKIDGIPFTIKAIQADYVVLSHPLGAFKVGLQGKVPQARPEIKDSSKATKAAN